MTVLLRHVHPGIALSGWCHNSRGGVLRAQKLRSPLLRKNPELTNVLPLKPEVGQNVALHASPTARDFCHVQIFTFYVHSPSFLFFSKFSPYFLTALVLTIAVSRVGPPSKIGLPAHRQKRFK